MCIAARKIETTNTGKMLSAWPEVTIEKFLGQIPEDEKNKIIDISTKQELKLALQFLNERFKENTKIFEKNDQESWFFKKIMSVFSGKKESDLETDKESIQQHIEALANSISIDDETNTSEILKTTSDRLCSVLNIFDQWDNIIDWIYQVSELEKDTTTMEHITKQVYKEQLSTILEYIKTTREEEFTTIMNNNTIDPSDKLQQWNNINNKKLQEYEELEDAIKKVS